VMDVNEDFSFEENPSPTETIRRSKPGRLSCGNISSHGPERARVKNGNSWDAFLSWKRSFERF
ncbi:MAG: hypothetical protein WBZ32_15375, partial [Candidatus Acidiferrales bacterium]